MLACGVDTAYPAGHRVLIDRIADQGLVVSEYPPTHSPARHRFLIRTNGDQVVIGVGQCLRL